MVDLLWQREKVGFQWDCAQKCHHDAQQVQESLCSLWENGKLYAQQRRNQEVHPHNLEILLRQDQQQREFRVSHEQGKVEHNLVNSARISDLLIHISL